MIIRNSAKCLICGDEVISLTRHDFRTCTCGNLSVDGGNFYLKRLVEDLDAYVDTSIEGPEMCEDL